MYNASRAGTRYRSKTRLVLFTGTLPECVARNAMPQGDSAARSAVRPLRDTRHCPVATAFGTDDGRSLRVPGAALLHDVEHRDGLAEALQRHLAALLQVHFVLDHDAAADQDLLVLASSQSRAARLHTVSIGVHREAVAPVATITCARCRVDGGATTSQPSPGTVRMFQGSRHIEVALPLDIWSPRPHK
jgi:hypothetical protein